MGDLEKIQNNRNTFLKKIVRKFKILEIPSTFKVEKKNLEKIIHR